MTQSPTGPAAFGSGAPWAGSSTGPADEVAPESHDGPDDRGRTAAARTRSRRLPGGRVVLVASLVIITVALLEVLERDRVGLWTGGTLVTVSVGAVLVTRPGDRSLPAMMPPLAFLAAVAIAGQRLLSPAIGDPRRRQGVMIIETLGANAGWVVAATAAAALLALIGHLVTRRSRRRVEQAEATTAGS